MKKFVQYYGASPWIVPGVAGHPLSAKGVKINDASSTWEAILIHIRKNFHFLSLFPLCLRRRGSSHQKFYSSANGVVGKRYLPSIQIQFQCTVCTANFDGVQILHHLLLTFSRRVFGKQYQNARCMFFIKTLKNTLVNLDKTLFVHILGRKKFGNHQTFFKPALF